MCWTKQQNPLEELRDLLGRAADGIALRKQVEVSFVGKSWRNAGLVVGGDWNHGTDYDFPYIGNVIIFFRGVGIPPTSWAVGEFSIQLGRNVYKMEPRNVSS